LLDRRFGCERQGDREGGSQANPAVAFDPAAVARHHGVNEGKAQSSAPCTGSRRAVLETFEERRHPFGGYSFTFVAYQAVCDGNAIDFCPLQ
jgi:hypothetical protein